MSKPPPVELDFSRKYDHEHSLNYLHKHQNGWARRLSHWRDVQLARRALKWADDPEVVLDLPCGAGRFWPLLAEQANRVILAADHSADMLNVAMSAHLPEIVARVKTFQTSAFAIDLSANAVDCIFCIRLLHHVQIAENRLLILREFHRVTRDTVILSLWVDGNYGAWKRRRLEQRRVARGREGQNQNRFIVPQTVIETEFRQAGFQIVAHQDFLPYYAMWRVYTLRKIA